MATTMHWDPEDSKCFNCGEEDASVLSFPPNIISGLNQVFGRKMKNNLTTSEALKSKSICKLCNSQFSKLLVAYDMFNNRTYRGSRISLIGETILSTDKEITQSQQPDLTNNGESNLLGLEVEVEYREKIPRLQISKLSDKYFPPISQERQNPISSYCRCIDCGRRFYNEITLQRHKEVAHSEITHFHSCQLCHYKFIHSWFYENHSKTVHGGIVLTFSCNLCKKTFKSQSELTQHKSKLHRMTTHPFKCNHCDTAFKTIEEIQLLRNHLIEFHPNTLEANAAQLNIKQAKEIEERRLPNYIWHCNICQLPFKTKIESFYHAQVEHNGLQSCQSCDTKFGSYLELSRHINRTGHKLTKCCKCQKICNATPALMRHMDDMHNPYRSYSHTCEVCRSPFTAHDKLRCHYKWHLQVSRPSSFHCDKCDKSYNLKHHLKIHMNRNHSTETFPCDICDKPFSSKMGLRKHKKVIHANAQPTAENQDSDLKKEISQQPESKTPPKKYRCDLCDISFDRPGGLTMHCRWAHVSSNFSKSKAIINYSEYAKYMSFNDDEPDRKFKCKICNAMLKRSDHLFRHIFTMHGIKLRDHKDFEPTYCELCDRTFPYVNYRKHLKVHKNHPNDTKLLHVRKRQKMTCNICDASCLGYRQVRNHFLGYHPGTKQAVTSNKNNQQLLKEKERKMNNVDVNLESENRCSKCLRLFPTIEEKKRHEIKMHKMRTKCLVCSKSFTSEMDYKEHENKDHKEYPCSYCNKVIYAVAELHSHLEEEHLQLPYCCEFCWTYFADGTKLLLHYREHFPRNPSIPKKCTWCDKTFVHHKSMKRHMVICSKNTTLKPTNSADVQTEKDESQNVTPTRPKRGCSQKDSKKKYKKSKYLNSSDSDDSNTDNSDSEELPKYSSDSEESPKYSSDSE